MAQTRKTRQGLPSKEPAGRRNKRRRSPLSAERAASTDSLCSRPEGELIVGIGASAGGLEALEEFFRHMPPDTGLAFVVVSHQRAGHVSLLPTLLGKCTPMTVREAADGLSVEPNHVYLAPGGMNLAFLRDEIHILEPNPKERLLLPIDFLFRSLADDRKSHAIGIILSGTGTDGTLGMRAIKAEGGMTLAQDPQTANYQGMPRSAIEAGVVDVVLPPGSMSESLLAYAHRFFKPAAPLPSKEASAALKKVYFLLRKRTGNDFTVYKESSIQRRVERRMTLHQMSEWKQYLRLLQVNPGELEALFQELLIGVTSFFRDPSTFEALVQTALPALIEGKPDGSIVRLWVAACSTGEEAYSLAILLAEFLAARKRRLTLQIFATDLDDRAIRKARSGIYPIGIAGDMPATRLQRFFIQENNHYRVKKEIRDAVVFAKHNLLLDAPFTKMDLISCRNVLIYLDSAAQHKLVSLFHYALNPNGILFLGTAESIGRSEGLFTEVNRKAKIFQRRVHAAAIPDMERGHVKPRKTHKQGQGGMLTVLPHTPSVPDLIQRVLVRRYAPASVIVNDQGQIMFIHGHTGAYLEPAPGPPTHHILDMARPGLRRALSEALRQAAGSDQEVVSRALPVDSDDGEIHVTATVAKLTEPEAIAGWFLLTFEKTDREKEPPAKGRRVLNGIRKKGQSGLLEELEYAKYRLQRSLDALQAAHEDAKSFNEELQSTNEELQSTNEELETTKEEMQSLNEELVTINSELQGKVEALAEVNDDLQNLVNSTEVATIFLDRDLRVKRFTSEAKQVSHLIALDVGRPLSDIVSKLKYDRMLEDALLVLRTLTAQEREVQSSSGAWFLMRIFPYRTALDRVDGLVLTFVDISRMKAAEQAMSASRGLAGSIMETVREPLLILNDQLGVIRANQVFYDTFQVGPREVEGQSLYHLCNDSWDSPELRSLLEEVLPIRNSFRDFVIDRTFPRIGRKAFRVNGLRLAPEAAQPGGVLLAMEECTSEC